MEYLDGGALRASRGAWVGTIPDRADLLVIAEADGSVEQAQPLLRELIEVLGEQAIGIHSPEARHEVRDLWRWRDGVSIAVTSQEGGKVSEDIVVPLDRLAEALTKRS